MSEVQTPVEGTEQVIVEPVINEEMETPNPTPAIEPVVVEPIVTPPAPVTDYEDKFRHSSSEALILHNQNKKKDELITKLTSQDAPTEAELREKYPDWDEYTDVTKTVFINQMTIEKRQNRIEMGNLEQEAEKKWQTELATLVSKPEYSKLNGDKEFEKFVFLPKHKGLDLDVLADAYLLRTGKTQMETPTPAPTNPVVDEGLPKGSGGGNPPAPQEYSVEEVQAMRRDDPALYKRLLLEGRL